MGKDILKTIVEQKLIEVNQLKSEFPENRLLQQMSRRGKDHFLYHQLSSSNQKEVNIIAEIKRASPSKGMIREDLNPEIYAENYEAGGASAISVLTDSSFFKGSIEDLKRVKETVSIPVLRKEFIISSYQIYESAFIGADSILLIKKLLSSIQLKDYLLLSDELGLDALVEIHSEEEIDAASKAGARLVGINNRNLNSFETSIETSIRLAGLLEPDQICVAESGIKSRQDIEKLQASGISNYLIGESLVRAPDTRRFLRELING